MTTNITTKEVRTQIQAIKIKVERNGHLTPIAQIAPVEVAGTKIEHASFLGSDRLTELNPQIGDTIIVCSAGTDKMAEVVGVLSEERPSGSQPFKMPTHCPECGSPVIRTADDEMSCLNSSCDPILPFSLLNWSSREAMEISGLGEKLGQQLIEHGLVKSIADLYDINADHLIALEGMGKKSAKNLLKAIAKSKSLPWSRVLASLGIRQVDRPTAQLLTQQFATVADLAKAEVSELDAIERITPEISQSVYNWFRIKANQTLIERLSAAGLQLPSVALPEVLDVPVAPEKPETTTQEVQPSAALPPEVLDAPVAPEKPETTSPEVQPSAAPLEPEPLAIADASPSETLSNIPSELDATVEQLQTVTQQSVQLQADLEQATQHSSQLQSELEEIRTSLKNAEQKTAQLQSELEESRQQLGQANQSELLESELAETRSQLTQAQEKSAQLNAQVEEIRTALESSTRQTEELRSQLVQSQQKSGELDSQLHEVRSQLQQVQQHSGQLQLQVEEAHHQVANLNTDLNATRTELQQAQQERSQIQSHLEERGEQLQQVEAEKQDLQTQLSNTRTQLLGVEEQRSHLETEIAHIKGESQRSQQQRADLEAQLAKSHAAQSQLQGDLSEIQEKLQGVLHDRSHSDIRVTQANSERSDALSQLEAANQQRAQIESQLALVRSQTPMLKAGVFLAFLFGSLIAWFLALAIY